VSFPLCSRPGADLSPSDRSVTPGIGSRSPGWIARAILLSVCAALALPAGAQAVRDHLPQLHMRDQLERPPTVQAYPQTARVATITVYEPWSRATAPGAKVGVGYMQIESEGIDDRLIAAWSSASARVELHTMSMENNVMRMREVPAIDLPAGRRVALGPGGLHLMLMDLKEPLRVGDEIDVGLRFEKAGELQLRLRVLPMNAQDAHGGASGAVPARRHHH
jgi:periplasmic copper chaperone A